MFSRFARRSFARGAAHTPSTTPPPAAPKMMGPTIPAPSLFGLPEMYSTTGGDIDSPEGGPLFADLSPLVRLMDSMAMSDLISPTSITLPLHPARVSSLLMNDPFSSQNMFGDFPLSVLMQAQALSNQNAVRLKKISDKMMAQTMRELMSTSMIPEVQQMTFTTPSSKAARGSKRVSATRTSHHYISGLGADNKLYERDEVIQSDSTGKKRHVVKHGVDGVVKTIKWECAPGQLEKDALHVVTYDSTAEKDLFDASWLKYGKCKKARVGSRAPVLGFVPETTFS